jgi:endonuclease
MKRFLIVIPKNDSGIEVYPMKEWLRQHPDSIPPGLDATASTSHQLRLGLKKLGWTDQVTETEIRLMLPGTEQANNAVGVVLGEEQEDDNDVPETSFALEYQLRDFIAQNIAAIRVDGHLLSLFVDQTGRDGIEYPTAVGPIDILAIDDSGAFVVFELKRARSPDHAIGQLSRYMGWVRNTIGKGKEVRGIIVAKRISDNLRYAVTVIPGAGLFEYEVSFSLKPIKSFESGDNVG